MPLLGLDHIELWVGNAVQAAHYFVTSYGFREVAAAGLETGLRDRASRVVQHREGSLRPDGAARRHEPGCAHVAAHGDGVRSLALGVPGRGGRLRHGDRARRARRGRAVRARGRARGRPPCSRSPPTARRFTRSSSAAATGPFLPGFVAVDGGEDLGLITEFDHAVGNVELGRMDVWVGFYERVLGFTEMLAFTTRTSPPSTRRSCPRSLPTARDASSSRSTSRPKGSASRRWTSTWSSTGSGVQHIAVQTPDIVNAVRC